jgi:hypothetical protein
MRRIVRKRWPPPLTRKARSFSHVKHLSVCLIVVNRPWRYTQSYRKTESIVLRSYQYPQHPLAQCVGAKGSQTRHAMGLRDHLDRNENAPSTICIIMIFTGVRTTKKNRVCEEVGSLEIPKVLHIERQHDREALAGYERSLSYICIPPTL